MDAETPSNILALLDGDLAPVERDRLVERARRDGDAARELEEALVLESLLCAAHQGPPDFARILDTLRARRPARPRLVFPVRLAAAAALVAALGAGLWFATRDRSAGALVEGRLLSAGLPVARARPGEVLRTPPDAGGTLRLPCGARVALAANSAAIVHAADSDTGQRVELLEGAGEFEVPPQRRPFAVWTDLGRVTVLGTRFGVRLVRDGPPGNAAPAGRAMEVAVEEGAVRVEFRGETHTLLGGQQRRFPPAPPAPLPPLPPPPEQEREPPPRPTPGQVPGQAPRRNSDDPPAGDTAPPARGPGITIEVDTAEWKTAVRTFVGIVADADDAALTMQVVGSGITPDGTLRLQLTPDTRVLVDRGRVDVVPTGSGYVTRRRLEAGRPSDLVPGRQVSAQAINGVAMSVTVYALVAYVPGQIPWAGD